MFYYIMVFTHEYWTAIDLIYVYKRDLVKLYNLYVLLYIYMYAHFMFQYLKYLIWILNTTSR